MKHSSFKITLLVLLVLFISTNGAHAQTNESIYRQTLIQLIEVLQQQIALLQNQIDNQVENETGLTFSDQTKATAVYEVSGKSSLAQISDSSHREYFERLYEIFPSEYSSRLEELRVFDNRDLDFDAYIESDNGEGWRYGASSYLIYEASEQTNSDLMVHELAHMVMYDKAFSGELGTQKNCHDYFDTYGCPPRNSYLWEFVEDFWSNSDLSRAESFSNSSDGFDQAYDYYKKYSSEYVSDYAAYNPEEDFAESFMFYVLDIDVEGGEAEDKIAFFNKYKDLVKLKQQIKNSL